MNEKELATQFAKELSAAETFSAAAAVCDRRLKSNRVRHYPPKGASVGYETDRIGMWRRDHDGIFVRDATLGDKYLWADVDRIPKKQRKRVVLLGESVARCFPYDPVFNCASALRSCLHADDERNQVEVLDLARNGITPLLLIELIYASQQLAPDLYVIFAGNNWFIDSAKISFDKVAATIRTDKSWNGVRDLIEQTIRKQTAQWVTSITEACRHIKVPLLFVIPAHNLVDWRSGPSTPQFAASYNPLLSSKDVMEHERILSECQHLFQTGLIADAENLASKLVEGANGLSPCGLEILARCALARGANEEAMHLFEQETETYCFVPTPIMKSYVTRTQEMRTRLRAEGIHIVDAAEVFAALPHGSPPGREFFLDRVHMTAQAIHAAIAAVAQAAVSVLELKARSILSTPSTAQVPPTAHAQAHFIAAIINAINGQDPELVEYHSFKAVENCSDIAAVMCSYVEMRVSREADIFSEGFNALTQMVHKFPLLRNFLISAGRPGEKSAPNWVLVRSLGKAASTISDAAFSHCESLILQKHGVNYRDLDLLPTDMMRVVGWSAASRCYVTSYTPRTEFTFVCDIPIPALELVITARVGSSILKRPLAVVVNNIPIDKWAPASNWSTRHVPVDPRVLQDGINTVVIVWPDPGESSVARLDRVAAACDVQPPIGFGSSPEIHVIFGELHSLVVRVPVPHTNEGVQ